MRDKKHAEAVGRVFTVLAVLDIACLGALARRGASGWVIGLAILGAVFAGAVVYAVAVIVTADHTGPGHTRGLRPDWPLRTRRGRLRARPPRG